MNLKTGPNFLVAVLVGFSISPVRADGRAESGRTAGSPALNRYQVQEGCHLKEVSLRLYGTPALRHSGSTALRLYGTPAHWQDIARWNQIPPPRYSLRRGQWLKLEKARILSNEEGERRVLAYWRKHFGLDIGLPRELPRAPLPPPEPPEVVHAKFEKEEQVQLVRAAEEGLGPSVEELKSEKSRDERFQTAQALFKDGKLAEALLEFHALRLEDPKRPEYWLREIASMISLGRRSEAKALARDFASEKPELSGIPFIAKLLAAPARDGTP